jgi:hypothetical protein
MRESSSGALVGKNIAGIGAIGKSQANILKDNGEKINLAKINMINSEQRKNFVTHGPEKSELVGARNL